MYVAAHLEDDVHIVKFFEAFEIERDADGFILTAAGGEGEPAIRIGLDDEEMIGITAYVAEHAED